MVGNPKVGKLSWAKLHSPLCPFTNDRALPSRFAGADPIWWFNKKQKEKVTLMVPGLSSLFSVESMRNWSSKPLSLVLQVRGQWDGMVSRLIERKARQSTNVILGGQVLIIVLLLSKYEIKREKHRKYARHLQKDKWHHYFEDSWC